MKKIYEIKGERRERRGEERAERKSVAEERGQARRGKNMIGCERTGTQGNKSEAARERVYRHSKEQSDQLRDERRRDTPGDQSYSAPSLARERERERNHACDTDKVSQRVRKRRERQTQFSRET